VGKKTLLFLAAPVAFMHLWWNWVNLPTLQVTVDPFSGWWHHVEVGCIAYFILRFLLFPSLRQSEYLMKVALYDFSRIASGECDRNGPMKSP